jgi:mannose PTS system EIIA component
MVGLLLITHAPVGAALLKAAAHVFGRDLQNCESIDVEADQSLAHIQDRACEMIAKLDTGHGVLVFSDLYGASPCNCASSLSSPGRVEVITGVSLPLLVRALNYRELELPDLTERLVAGAAQSVVRISGHAPQNQTFKPTPDGSPGRQQQ